MPGDSNTDTNQTSKTIRQDESEGVENPPAVSEKGSENIPPVEVPGRSQTPEQIPEKSRK